VSRVIFTARAREDLLDIWLYVATHNSEAVADRVYDSIEKSCRSLSNHPQLGRVRPEIQPEARSLVIERWLALYRVTEYGAQIARIIDAARDLSAIEWSPEQNSPPDSNPTALEPPETRRRLGGRRPRPKSLSSCLM
jgi:toxin ParE1/3/4